MTKTGVSLIRVCTTCHFSCSILGTSTSSKMVGPSMSNNRIIGYCRILLTNTICLDSLTLMSCWINEDATLTSNFQPVRVLDPGCRYKFTYLITNCADPISWHLQKPTDLNLHLQKQGISRSSRTRLTLSTMGKNFSRWQFLQYFSYFFQKIGFEMSWKFGDS